MVLPQYPGTDLRSDNHELYRQWVALSNDKANSGGKGGGRGKKSNDEKCAPGLRVSRRTAALQFRRRREGAHTRTT